MKKTFSDAQLYPSPPKDLRSPEIGFSARRKQVKYEDRASRRGGPSVSPPRSSQAFFLAKLVDDIFFPRIRYVFSPRAASDALAFILVLRLRPFSPPTAGHVAAAGRLSHSARTCGLFPPPFISSPPTVFSPGLLIPPLLSLVCWRLDQHKVRFFDHFPLFLANACCFLSSLPGG